MPLIIVNQRLIARAFITANFQQMFTDILHVSSPHKTICLLTYVQLAFSRFLLMALKFFYPSLAARQKNSSVTFTCSGAEILLLSSLHHLRLAWSVTVNKKRRKQTSKQDQRQITGNEEPGKADERIQSRPDRQLD